VSRQCNSKLSIGVDVGRDLDPVLDPKQLSRIEGVHRGFFYQHLYASNLLLLMPGSQTVSVAVERDEDVEVRRPSLTIYIQIKTRVGALTPSDIEALSTALRTFVKYTHEASAVARPPSSLSPIQNRRER
jgi:hypothetical protein